MEIKRGNLYVVDFNPRVKTKPGKLRPAVVLQSDLVNQAGYPSTIVIPTKGHGLAVDSDLLLGQLIAVANESFRKEIGTLSTLLMEELESRVRILLGL
jgi:mRNA interferase MazF